MAHDTAHDAHRKTNPGDLKERRFLPEPTTRGNLRALAAGLGMAALGASTYAAWVHEAPLPATPYLFSASVLGLLGAWAMGSEESAPLRVGDAGIGVERGEERPDRLAWWEIEKVRLDDNGRVVVEGAGRRIVVSPRCHAPAAGLLVEEALARIPKRVSIGPDAIATLTRDADASAGTVMAAPRPQVAGRRCKASNAIISFERDAVTCSRCGEVYDRKQVPPQCLTCDAPLASAAHASVVAPAS
jgi:hypothetical protein